MEVKLSRFTHFFTKVDTGYTALHNALSLETIFLENDAVKLLKENNFSQCDDEAIETLRSMGFVVNMNDNENVALDKVRQRLKPDLWVMYLILTDKCNLQCKYCFIEAGFSENYVFVT